MGLDGNQFSPLPPPPRAEEGYTRVTSVIQCKHRRRIKTEEKVKVVAAVWGTELIKFLAVLTILHQDDLKKGINSSYSSYRPAAIHPIYKIFLVQNS